MALTVGAVASLPLVAAMASESALAQTVSGADLTVQQTNVASVDAFDAFKRQLDGRVTARLGSQLVPLTDFVAAAPFSVLTVNAAPPTLSGNLQVIPTFMDHLGGHVQMLAGQLPPDGLGGDEFAATMPQDGADQIGLHLSDRFCAGSTSQRGPVWCARIVGLWRPLNSLDPFWGGSVPRLQLMTPRYDFFQLIGLQPGARTVAGITYRPNPYSISSAHAADSSRRVSLLRRDLAANPNLRVQSTFEQAMETFAQRQATATAAIDRVTLAVGLLALTVVALITHQLLDSQARERAELLREGRSPAWIWSLSVVSLGAVSAVATGAGLLGAALVVAAFGFSGSGLNPQWLRPSDLGGISAVVVGGIGGIVLVPAELAALSVAVSRETEPPPGRQDPGRLARWRPSGLARVGGGLLRLPRKMRGEISGTLARSQLEQRPEQHAGAAFVLALATAMGLVLAVQLVAGMLGPSPRVLPVLAAGQEAIMLMALPVVLALAALAWGIHFRSTAEHRQQEYGTLFATGLPQATVAGSVAGEERAVLRPALAVGTVVGIGVLAALQGPALLDSNLALGAVGAAGSVVCIGLVARAAGRIARRLPLGEPARPAKELPAP
jgi:hypothetical protein